MTKRESIVDRIRKLRVLANDPNSLEEATTAAKLVEQLIQKYQVDEAELIFQEGETETPKLDDEPVETFGKRQNVWKNVLSLQLAKLYNCTTVFQRKSGSLGLYIIGRPSDIEIVKYNYAYLSLQITRLAEKLQPDNLFRGAAKGWRNSFYLGAVDSILATMEQEKQVSREQATSNALVVIDRHYNETMALQKKLFPSASEHGFNSRVDGNAYNVGYEAGKGLQSKPSLPGGPKLLNR